MRPARKHHQRSVRPAGQPGPLPGVPLRRVGGSTARRIHSGAGALYHGSVQGPDATSGPLRHGATRGEAGPGRRLLLAGIALLAGNSALLLVLLLDGLLVRSMLLKTNMGEPHRVLSQMIEIFSIYAVFSVVGWVLVGVPTALAIPPRLLLRVAWPFRVVIGAAMGPLALLLIFVVLAAMQGRLGQFSLAHTESLWPFSVLVSTVSFLAYTGLLRSQRANGAG